MIPVFVHIYDKHVDASAIVNPRVQPPACAYRGPMDHHKNENEQEHHNPETEEDTGSGGPADPPGDDTPPENPSGG